MDIDAISPSPLRIYFIPFLATGHMVPLLELSRFFASRGEHVTVITTHSSAKSLVNYIDKDKASGHHIHIHHVTFPSKELGLPDGLENPLSAPNSDIRVKIHTGVILLQQQMEHFMQQNPPDCIVSDAFYPWTSDFANSLGIPRLVFDGSGIFAACLKEAIRAPNSPHSRVSSDKEPFLIGGLPHPITMTLSQLPESQRTRNHANYFMENLREAELKSYGRLVNNFAELDVEYTKHYEKIMGLKVWQVGPTHLIYRIAELKAERFLKHSAVNEEECLSWLNSKEPNSVVYICFGSGCVLTDNQLHEIACGIQSSGHHFIWVVLGKDNIQNQSEKLETGKWLPEGFEERVTKPENKKGIILRGWAPQVMILDHPATGGFMTHCGWNSVLEGVCAGVPMITWPLTSEQFYNEKLITQVHRIGVEVGTNEWSRDASDAGKNMVSRDRIEEAVRRLMDGGDEAMEMRRRAREMADKSKAAVEDGGSSQKNLTALIQDLKRLRPIRATAMLPTDTVS